MKSILLKNVSLSGVHKDILTGGELIKKIGPAGAHVSWDLAGDIEIMDCTGKAALPGFVNMHTHSPMSMMKGIAEDVLFKDWLGKVWDVEAHFDPEYIYQAARVACIEMIRTGTTTFNDQYWSFESIRRAASEMGIRAAVGYDLMDRFDPEEAKRQMDKCMQHYEEFKDNADGHLFVLAFHAPYSVSEPLMLWASDFARRNGIKLHIHLCETLPEVEDCKKAHGGLTPVEYLDELGILGPEVIAAHTLWLSPHDVEILGARRVSCVHNINSNAKLSSGYRFLYNELRDAGANVCIGTDGCASSNNLDMLEAMKTSALFQKAWREDPTALPLDELLDMATVNGARALGLDIGVIREGASADIDIVDTDNCFFLSPGSFLANLIYSAHSDCIDSVISKGRFAMRGRQIEGEKEILAQARTFLGVTTV